MPTPPPPASANRAARRAALRRAGRVGAGTLLAGTAPLALLAGGAGPAGASTITVANTNDSGGGSLRAALGSATAGDVVDLTGVSGTILLTTGAITVPAGVTITGPGASVLTIDGGDTDGIFTVTGTGTGTISGLTFTRGNRANGGAILCDHQADADLTIADSAFIDNYATSDAGAVDWTYCGDLTITGSTFTANGAYSDAGAVSFYYSATFTLSGSTFTGNSALDRGGALQAEGDTGVTVTVSDTTFVDNTSQDEGGGMVTDGDISVTITGSTFRGNETTEQKGGGFAALAVHSVTLTDVEFDDNTAYSDGGGFLLYADDVDTLTRVNAHGNHAYEGGGGFFYGQGTTGGLTITDSVFDGNDAQYGGALVLGEIVSGPATITGTTFSGNTADSFGGAVRVINGDSDPATPLLVERSTFSGNSATYYGGAVALEGDSAEFVNSTFSANHAANGAALYTASDVALTFVTISGNVGTDVVGGILVNGAATVTASASIIAGNGTDDVGTDSSGYLVADHSVLGTIDESVTFTDGGGNVTGVSDPGLGALADNGGPTLTMEPTATSPALDRGPASTPITTDQRGVPYVRVYGPKADAGAVEVQPDPDPDPVPGPEPIPEPTFTG